MGKEDRERIAALEKRMDALEADRPGRVFTATNAYDEEPEEVKPEPSLWWFEGRFWVGDDTLDPGEIGQVKEGEVVRLEDGSITRFSAKDDRVLADWREVLRPAKTFRPTHTRPELVESGERRRVRPGSLWGERDWYIDPDRGRPMYKGADGATPLPILISVSEARRRCGLDSHEGDLSGSMEDRLTEALRQRDKAEARVKELEAQAAPDHKWMRERLQEYPGSPEEVDELVKRACRVVARPNRETVRDLWQTLTSFEGER